MAWSNTSAPMAPALCIACIYCLTGRLRSNPMFRGACQQQISEGMLCLTVGTFPLPIDGSLNPIELAIQHDMMRTGSPGRLKNLVNAGIGTTEVRLEGLLGSHAQLQNTTELSGLPAS